MSVFDIDTSDIKLIEWLYEEIDEIEDEDIFEFVENFDLEKDTEKYARDPERTIKVFEKYLIRLYEHDDYLLFAELVEILAVIAAKLYKMGKKEKTLEFGEFLHSFKGKLKRMSLELTVNRENMLDKLEFWAETLVGFCKPESINVKEIISAVRDALEAVRWRSPRDKEFVISLSRLDKVLLKIFPGILLRMVDSSIYVHLEEILSRLHDLDDEVYERVLKAKLPNLYSMLAELVYTLERYIKI